VESNVERGIQPNREGYEIQVVMLIQVVGTGMIGNERLCKKRWCTCIVKRES